MSVSVVKATLQVASTFGASSVVVAKATLQVGSRAITGSMQITKATLQVGGIVSDAQEEDCPVSIIW